MSTFIEQYRNLIIQQYYDRTKAPAEIDLYSSEFELIFNFISDFENQFDLDQATGDRLDLIGKIVGASRIVESADPVIKEYFSFADNPDPNARTFGEAPFFDIVNDTQVTDTELDDVRYRFYLRAKISKNIAAALMESDDQVSIQDIIQYLFNGKAFVVDNLDMSLTIYVDEDIPEEDIKLILDQDLIPKPQGVRYKFVIKYSDGLTFGFAGNPNAKTFGEGRFASILDIT